jgi:hypothetical protein
MKLAFPFSVTGSTGISPYAGTRKPNEIIAVPASQAVPAFPYTYMCARPRVHITQNAVIACYAGTKLNLKGFSVTASTLMP